MSEDVPAAWFPDPFQRYEQRYWDGGRWTEHVVSGGLKGIDPPVDAVRVPSISRVKAGWHPDPFGRHEQRYWDGNQWTEHVHSRGLRGVDPPVEQVMTPAVGHTSKKVARQARKAGADSQSGGGTLFTEQVLVVNQKAKVFGSRLEYAVFGQNGRQLGKIQEMRRDLTTKLSDSLRGRTEGTREHRFRVVDMGDQVLLALTRPKMGFFQMRGMLVVEGSSGAPIGHVVHESFGVGGAAATAAPEIAHLALGGIAGMFAGAALEGVQERLGLDKIGHARFGLEAGGQRLGSVHAESIEQWDFNVKDQTGTEIARITKTWAGWAKERVTRADNYVVQMHRPLEEPLRSLIIAAALAIDMELKQRGDQTSGSALWGTRRYE